MKDMAASTFLSEMANVGKVTCSLRRTLTLCSGKGDVMENQRPLANG